MNNDKLQEIMSQKISTELEKKMKPLLEELKLELLVNNSHSINKPGIKINKVFGSLISIKTKVYLIFNPYLIIFLKLNQNENFFIF